MDPVAGFLRTGFGFLVRRRLRGVWLRGEPPAGPFVWASNHHGWWDAFVAAVVLWSRGREITVLMDPVNLERFAYLRRLGVLGTNEPRRTLAALASGRVVVIFPEGRLRPPGPLAPLHPGARWLASRAGVPLVAVAVRVVLRGHESPEAYLDLEPVGPADLRDVLSRRLEALDGLLATADPREPLPGFERAIGGRRSWDERLDRSGRS